MISPQALDTAAQSLKQQLDATQTNEERDAVVGFVLSLAAEMLHGVPDTPQKLQCVGGVNLAKANFFRPDLTMLPEPAAAAPASEEPIAESSKAKAPK